MLLRTHPDTVKCEYGTNTVCVASQSTSCHVPKWQLFIVCTHEWSRAAANSRSIQTHKVVDSLQSFNAERMAWEVCPIQTIEEKVKQRPVKGKRIAMLNILIPLHYKLKPQEAQIYVRMSWREDKDCVRIVRRDTHTHGNVRFPSGTKNPAQIKIHLQVHMAAEPHMNACMTQFLSKQDCSWIFLQYSCRKSSTSLCSQNPSWCNLDLTSALNLFCI